MSVVILHTYQALVCELNQFVFRGILISTLVPVATGVKQQSLVKCLHKCLRWIFEKACYDRHLTETPKITDNS